VPSLSHSDPCFSDDVNAAIVQTNFSRFSCHQQGSVGCFLGYPAELQHALKFIIWRNVSTCCLNQTSKRYSPLLISHAVLLNDSTSSMRANNIACARLIGPSDVTWWNMPETQKMLQLFKRNVQKQSQHQKVEQVFLPFGRKRQSPGRIVIFAQGTFWKPGNFSRSTESMSIFESLWKHWCNFYWLMILR